MQSTEPPGASGPKGAGGPKGAVGPRGTDASGFCQWTALLVAFVGMGALCRAVGAVAGMLRPRP